MHLVFQMCMFGKALTKDAYKKLLASQYFLEAHFPNAVCFFGAEKNILRVSMPSAYTNQQDI